MMENLKHIGFISILSTIILFSTLGPAYAIKTPKPVTLQLKWYHQFQFAGYYAALEKGFYLDEGLDVTIVEGDAAIRVDQRVSSGDAHYGVLASELIEKRLQGEPLVMLAVIMQHSIRTLITLADSAIAAPSDLIQRPIMLNPNEQIEFLAMFAREGIKREALVFIDKDSLANEKLISGKVAAINGSIGNQPYTFAEKGINVRTIRPIDYGIDFYGDALFTSEAELGNHPLRVAAFRRASIRGWVYAMEHPDELIELILTKYNPRKSRAQLQFEANALKSLILPKLVDIGHVNPGRIERIAATYAEFGLVPHSDNLKGFIYTPNPPRNYRWLLWVLAVVASATAILLLFNRHLNSKVKQQTRLLSNKNSELKTEIIERKRAKNLLQKNEEVLRATLEVTQEGVLVIDADGNISHCNYRFRQIWSIPEALTRNTDNALLDYVIDQIAAADIDHFLTRIRQIYGTADITTDRLNLKDGRIIDRFTAPLICEGKEQGRVWCFTDMTATIRAHELTTNSLTQAEEARAKIDEILKAVPQGLIVTDMSGRVILTNNAAERLTGIIQSELFQRPLCDIFDNESLRERLNITLAGQPLVPPIDLDLYDHDREQQCTVQLQTSLVRDNDGKNLGAIVLLHDVTREREVARMKNEFISTTAHELNTPLTSVMGYAELLRDNWHSDLFNRNQQHEFIGTIYEQCQRLSGIVDELLQLGQSEFGQSIVLDKTSVDLGAVIDEIVKNYQAGKYTDRLHFLPSSTPTTVSVDVKKLSQVIENLLSNAIKYSSDSSPIHIHCAAKEAHCQFSIRDEGIGMTAEQKSKMFEKFYRADTSTTAIGGLGLGASIVNQIVKAHGGKIEVISNLDKGTTITITLPTSPQSQQ